MRSSLKRYITLVLALYLMCTVCGCKGKEENIPDEGDDGKIVSIVQGDNTWDVKVEGDKIKYYENSEYIGDLNGDYPSRPLMSLPEAVKAEDLSKFTLITVCTYEMTPQDASNYMLYLEGVGYTTELVARTPSFIEVYMAGEDETFKRLIIGEEYTVISDLDYLPLLEIQNYLYK